MSARLSIEFSPARRAAVPKPMLRLVEAPAKHRGGDDLKERISRAPRHSFGLFALRTPPELGLLPALVVAVAASAALGYLAYAGLEHWALMLP